MYDITFQVETITEQTLNNIIITHCSFHIFTNAKSLEIYYSRQIVMVTAFHDNGVLVHL